MRELLLKEQQNKCAITGQRIHPNNTHADHRHDEQQLVRGAVHASANTLIGKIENLQLRFLNHWYEGSLSEFLRNCADYLDKEPDKRWRHPGWLIKIKQKFNKLKADQQNDLLVQLQQSRGTNLKERQKYFNKAVLSRQYGYITLLQMIAQYNLNTKDN